MKNRKFLYLLHDQSNSNPNSRNYCWWFETKELALNFKKQHEKDQNKSKLTGPYLAKLYRRSDL